MDLIIQPKSPIVTPAKLQEISGIPADTIKERMRKGELPEICFGLEEDKKSSKYVNMVLLHKICAEQDFDHPLLSRS